MPDAESRRFDSGSEHESEPCAGFGRGASPLYRVHQSEKSPDRPSVPGAYGSVAMDEAHLVMAARYVAMKPVKARLIDRPGDWPWPNARAHLAGTDDELVRVRPLLDRIGDFAGFLDCGESDDNTTDFDKGQTIG